MTIRGDSMWRNAAQLNINLHMFAHPTENAQIHCRVTIYGDLKTLN